MEPVKTVERVAAITATLHDGRSMIVLTKGKTVTVAESSLAFLAKHKALKQEGAAADGEGGADDAGSGDDGATVGDFVATKGNAGWYVITGPGIDPATPVKVKGEANAKTKLAELEAALADADSDGDDKGGDDDTSEEGGNDDAGNDDGAGSGDDGAPAE
ncbi:hypothetical protein GRI97_08115 [Altererythrobacter xixiisoli]|uniref:Uncharacterized protein n=1 Tax=Croceibacterium xixiisoli TaxID=1476466 RepID=A0A6I4TUS5_9SPHN|nr:hypothetical protein [Croceibacterium xixiisoli]MXO98951.1 hypothetical protein [Croceibacterium xixiisoli]